MVPQGIMWSPKPVINLPVESTQHHLRHAFDDQLHELEHDVLDMGSRAEQMVGQAVEALKNLDSELAMIVIKRDDEIDERDLSIEFRCLRVLALQHPTAGDLRRVGTIMKMITDIERVGDLAVDIAKIALKVAKEFGEPNFVDIPRLANEARAMLRQSLEAFVRSDMETVQAVIDRDERVDEMYRDLRAQIFDNMKRQPDNVVTDGWLLMAIHHLERVADHAVNIAERVSFIVTGEFRQLTDDHRSDRPNA